MEEKSLERHAKALLCSGEEGRENLASFLNMSIDLQLEN